MFFTFIILFFSGILAGIMGSVTGMASIVSYPILLATGLSPVVANVTNTAGLIFSGIGSTTSSRRELKANLQDLRWILPIALLGSLLGSILLLTFPSKVFEKVVPFLIIAVDIFYIFQPHFQKTASSSPKYGTPVKKSLLNFVAIFLIGMYGGYFGAASGLFMVIVFSMTKGLSLVVANAMKNVTMGATNILATLVYVFLGHINWLYALMMGVGLFLGGYIGPIIARHLPQQILRRVIIAGAFILAAYMFIEAFF